MDPQPIPARNTYRLRFTDLGRDLSRDIEFEAADDAGALAFVREAAFGRTAHLWRNGKPVARLRSSAAGWSVLPA